MQITAIILTFNEEIHIARCVENAKKIANEIYVVDSFSIDATCSIAAECGARVVQHKFVNQAQQFQWALDTLECSGDWILRLDADEYLTEECISEIKQTLPLLPDSITGCNIPRDVYFLEKNVRHGRIKPPYLLRLWRKGCVYMEQRWMDEQCVLIRGNAINLKSRFVDYNLNNLTWWTQKHNTYSNRELAVEVCKFYGFGKEDAGLGGRNAKKSLYYKLPPFFRAGAFFLIKYLILGGFLDGKAGFLWATLQTYWYRILVDAKWYEMQKIIGKKPSEQEVKEYFSKLSLIHI